MRTRSVKQALGATVAVAIAALIAVGLVALALVVQRTNTGADPMASFTQVPAVPDDVQALITWLPDGELARRVEPTTREAVGAAWARGWHRLDVAQRTHDSAGIETWFVGALPEQIAASVGETQVRSSVTQFGHTMQITFYSLDGSIIGLESMSDIERAVESGPSRRSVERLQAVLVLSDGNWRVRHLTALPTSSTDKPTFSEPT